MQGNLAAPSTAAPESQVIQKLLNTLLKVSWWPIIDFCCLQRFDWWKDDGRALFSTANQKVVSRMVPWIISGNLRLISTNENWGRSQSAYMELSWVLTIWRNGSSVWKILQDLFRWNFSESTQISYWSIQIRYWSNWQYFFNPQDFGLR